MVKGRERRKNPEHKHAVGGGGGDAGALTGKHTKADLAFHEIVHGAD
jgi:hypothetical protein